MWILLVKAEFQVSFQLSDLEENREVGVFLVIRFVRIHYGVKMQ